ncbi:MAG: hypothetical protein JSW67_00460 [Candidatus Latescibacterota bacterium]|nr:MAG: hypothetical protein JSW67_00460 [Candidatus Latescibacterota bacterium]
MNVRSSSTGPRGRSFTCCILLLLCVCGAVRPARAADPEKVHGITLSTHTNGSDWATGDVATTMSEMREVGAGWVAIHPYAAIRADGQVRFRALERGSLPEHLAKPIREARRQGLRIVLKPHLAYWGTPFRWRGDIEFHEAPEWERFWATYSRWIVNLAAACPDVDGFVVGTELDRTLAHEERWRALIQAVRAQTGAPLTYAANWTDYQRVGFWDALDAIGIQAYFPLADRVGAGPEAIARRWDERMRELRAYAAHHDRKIVFTELGYNRAFAAPVRPWDDELDGAEAEQVQATCLRLALAAIEREPSVVGAFLWKWFPNPYPVGRTYQLATPRIKRAISEIWLE